MIRFALYFGSGLAIGYAVSRAMEARANGVPLDAAFKLDLQRLLTPTKSLLQVTTLPKVQVAK